MKKIILSLLALATMVSCSKTNEITNDGPKEILFGSSVSFTKAAVDNTTAIDVQIVRGTDGAPGNFTTLGTPFTGAKAAGGAITVTEKQYFSAGQKAANFIAYYPAGAKVDNVISYTIDGDMDIITAAPINITYAAGTGQFTFKHMLAQVKFVIKSASDDEQAIFGNLTAATISGPSALEMTATNGVFAIAANTIPANIDFNFLTADKTLSTVGANGENTFMILPTALTAIKLTFANKTEDTYTITGLVLEAGKTTTITATVTVKGVAFSSTITPWEVGGKDGTVDVE